MLVFAYLPGLVFCFVLSFLAFFLSAYLPSIGHISLSLLLGLLVGNLFPLHEALRAGTSFSEKKILEFSIALLGFNLSRHELSFLSLRTAAILILMVILVVFLSLFLGKLLRFPSKLSFLIGVGSGVCGSAAIMATSQIIRAPKKDIVISLAITQFLGIIALFALPFLLRDFDKHFSAMMIGGSLQAMGHVVASTSLLDSESANIAITLKMVRILLLTPIVIFLSFYMSRKRKRGGLQAEKMGVPFYIIFFIVFVCLTNFFHLPQSFLYGVKKLSHGLFSIAMVALGSNIQFSSLSKGFGRYTSFAAVIFLLQCLFLFVLL